ncbi:enolase C-terminal domain-like protein [Granulicella arctica]|uniref:enolase C-terminal domain-like protein n=1 Tax=Granulicella arctica TaxID=940613 RepID=UPI0021E0005D|nr:enolase C-terminal domain-like protein [Granulicella arctica]
MGAYSIDRISSFDARYPLPAGAGSDAVHTDPEYCLAVTQLHSSQGEIGSGFALTLGEGNRLVCEAIELLAPPLRGMPIEDLMAQFGRVARELADDPKLRWLGPHKGVVHLALASITNACFDLWAKSRGVPLWKLLLDLTPEEVVRLLDLSYLDEVMNEEQAIELLQTEAYSRSTREGVLQTGYPGYDTSVGWMAYDDAKVKHLTEQAIARGFTAFKLKVGSKDHERDLRRAAMLRECAGDAGTVMFDANQQWTLPVARTMCAELVKLKPLWIEEPTHPDDVVAHATLAREIAPVKIATGEHIPNRVVFKNFIESAAVHYVQADCTRLAGVSEFLAVSLLARKFKLPVVPHVGDMGQIHQHLVIFNHIAMGHEAQFLEHIPHLRSHFLLPAEVERGYYRTPQEPGSSSDLKELASRSGQ